MTEKDIDDLKKFKAVEAYQTNYELQMEQIQQEIQKIESYKRKTYDNFMEELISKTDYVSYISDYDKKILKLKRQKESISEKVDMQEELNHQYDEWTEAFKNYINVSKLTREMVLELINRIEVHDDGAIDIYYRFSNPYL